MRLEVTPASPAPPLHLENLILAVNFRAGSICQLRQLVVTGASHTLKEDFGAATLDALINLSHSFTVVYVFSLDRFSDK